MRPDEEEIWTCWVCGTEIGPPDGDEAESPTYTEDILWRTCGECAQRAR